MQQPELRQTDTRISDFANKDRQDRRTDRQRKRERVEKGEEGERERERKQNNMPERLPASTKDGGGQGL